MSAEGVLALAEKALAVGGWCVGLARTQLDFRRALVQAGRLRHDLNNVLTAALAETQLLLLAEELEEREAVEAIEEQLRRFRDRLASAAQPHTGHR